MSGDGTPQLDPFEKAKVVQRSNDATYMVLAGLLGAPATAGLWVLVGDLARAVDAGRIDPARWLRLNTQDPFTYVLGLATFAAQSAVGTAGVHLACGLLVTAVAGVGVWGWAAGRRLDRRYGHRAVAQASREALLRESPALAAQVAEVEARRGLRPEPRSARTGALGALFWLIPAASVVATIGLVLRALG